MSVSFHEFLNRGSSVQQIAERINADDRDRQRLFEAIREWQQEAAEAVRKRRRRHRRGQ